MIFDSEAARSPLEVLSQVFGHDAFRHPQQEIIELVVNGGDAVVLMPTGGGKSLCYQIPAIVRPGTAIVVSPLIALMQDQVEALRGLGVRAAYLNSTQARDESLAVEQALRLGELDLLYVAPERLLTPRFLSLLDRARLALFAIDEAHCVSQWGHDFRPEYIQLGTLAERFPSVPRVALTATADAPTRRDIVERLGLQSAPQFISSFDRPNICFQITEAAGSSRQRLLQFIRDRHAGNSGIVYCLSRRKVEEVAAFLQGEGLNALAYHAGLERTERAGTLRRFIREEGVIVVATIAFGMGIDKPDVRFVAHLNMPKSLEAYYQETGRAGRDGLACDAWMVYQLQDVIQLRQMLDQSEAGEEHKRIERARLDAMLGYCELTSCRRQALLAYFGETLAEPCGNCDVCLDPPQLFDATVPAQKALSTVHRTGQRFGVTYLIDVLRGKEDERIRSFGHDQVSTFGIGQDLAPAEWRAVFRQLIAHGYLAVDHEGHGGLRLTEACRPVLRGDVALRLRKPTGGRGTAPGGRTRGRRRSGPAGLDLEALGPADRQLWEALRQTRREIADRLGVPGYVVFNDASLSDMLERRPTTAQEMRSVAGVGDYKLEHYGEAFLKVIREHPTVAE